MSTSTSTLIATAVLLVLLAPLIAASWWAIHSIRIRAPDYYEHLFVARSETTLLRNAGINYRALFLEPIPSGLEPQALFLRVFYGSIISVAIGGLALVVWALLRDFGVL
jgi:hypothetical protein